MLWVTKVFHPGAPRVGKLSKNITLPRSVPLPVVFAVPVGGALGAVGGIALDPVLGLVWPRARVIMISATIGAGLATLLVSVQPWRGEHVHRVAAVRAMAFASARLLMCPGSGLPAAYSEEAGTLVCSECGRVFGDANVFTPQHQWRRRVYLGMKPIPVPTTGEVHMTAGSTPKQPMLDPPLGYVDFD